MSAFPIFRSAYHPYSDQFLRPRFGPSLTRSGHRQTGLRIVQTFAGHWGSIRPEYLLLTAADHIDKDLTPFLLYDVESAFECAR